jgi:predicted enzyme related to lactoylglutathione lyase
MPNPVAYFELGGRHASELREFYRGLFGWNVEPFGQSAAGTDFFHVEPEEGGIAGGIIQTSGEMPPNYVMFYVSVDDLQASLDKVERLGGKSVVPPMPIPGGMGHIAVFMDPDDNVIGLHSSA